MEDNKATTLRLALRLGKKDSVIIAWHHLVSERMTLAGDSGKISFMIKNALLYYIKTGNYLCIGKLRESSIHAVSAKPSYISFYHKNLPDIQDWIDSLKRNCIAPGTRIKEILRQSILIVPDTQEEWLLDYRHMDIYAGKQNQVLDLSLLEYDTSKPREEMIPVTISKPSELKENEISSSIPSNDNRSKQPQCSGLFADDNW